MNAIFKSTLDLIPNGILLIDIKTQQINFANKEMKGFIAANEDEEDYNGLKSKVCTFLLQDSG